MRLNIAQILFAFAVVVGISSATGCGTTPAGIPVVYCTQLTINNAQSTAQSANTQTMIPINALVYNAVVLSNSLQNIAVYNSLSGATAPNWLEGNTLNEQQQSNTLYTSANVALWVKLPDVIPASGSDTNWYLGFTANTMNLFGNSIAQYGEAPQLTCTNPAATATCSGTTGTTGYGYWDNGANVFNFYDNFAGGSLSTSNWKSIQNAAYTVANGIAFTGASGGPGYIGSNTLTVTPNNDVIDALANVYNAPSTSTGTNAIYFAGSGNKYDYNAIAISSQIFAATWKLRTATWDASGGVAQTTFTTNPANILTVYTVFPVNAIATTFYYSYGNSKTETTHAPTYPTNILLAAMPNVANQYIQNPFIQVYRVRTPPPNNIQPSITFGTLQANPPTVAISNPSNSIVDVNQYESFTATITGACTSCTFNFLTVNSITNSITGNYLIAGSSPYTYTFQVTSPNVYNSPEAMNVIAYSALFSVNSPYSSTFTIYPALSTVTISPSTTQIIDNGQSTSFTSSVSGGTSTYSYQWYSGSSATCTSDSPIGGATSNTYAASPTSSTFYCLKVSDTATTNNIGYSTGTQLIVYPTLVANMITPNAPTIDQGQSITLTSNAAGGAPSLVINWFANGACTQPSVASGTTYTPSPSSTTSYSYNAVDAATTNAIQCSPSDTVTVKSPLVVAPLSTSPMLPTTLSGGSQITFTSSWTGGAQNYQANYILTNTISGAILFSQLYTGITTLGNVFIWTIPSTFMGNTIKANVLITDSAYSAITKNSIYTNTLTVSSGLGIPLLTASNSLLDLGQFTLLTATWGPSGPTYAAYYYNITGSKALQSYSGISFTYNTYFFQTGILGTFTYNVAITDSLSNTVNSTSISLVVNPTLQLASWAASDNPIVASSVGKMQNLKAGMAGGSPNYNYYFTVYNASGTLVTTASYATTSNSQVYSFIQRPAWGVGTFTANIMVSDSATTPEDVIDSLTYVVTAGGSIVTAPNITRTCKFALTGGDLGFSCNATDQNQLIVLWNLTIFNNSAIIQPNVIASNTQTGYAFSTYTINGLSQHGVMAYTLKAFENASTGGAVYTYYGKYGLQPASGFSMASSGFIAIVFYLIGLAAGGYVGKENASVALSYTLFIEAFMTVFLFMAGPLQALGVVITGGITLVFILVGLLTLYYQGSPQSMFGG